jgi:integrase
MTTISSTSIVRWAKGIHPRRAPVEQSPGRKGSITLPEYLEAQEVQAVLAVAPNPRARLLMLLQWRAGLRVSEALALQPADLSLDSDHPTIRVRHGKGGRSRIVPVHPELQNALVAVLQFADVARTGRIIGASRSTAWRWVQTAVERAVELGGILAGRRVGTHTFRHSYARHLLLHGVPINYLSRWLGHRAISTTLDYLELVPDPAGRLASVP